MKKVLIALGSFAFALVAVAGVFVGLRDMRAYEI